MQRRRLARAGRTDDEADPVRLLEDRLELPYVAIREAHLLEGEGLRSGEDAHDHILVAARGRDGRDAQLDAAHGALETDLAVLGPPLLGDVEPGHDLDALDEGV